MRRLQGLLSSVRPCFSRASYILMTIQPGWASSVVSRTATRQPFQNFATNFRGLQSLVLMDARTGEVLNVSGGGHLG
jgi:hypothetical protein